MNLRNQKVKSALDRLVDIYKRRPSTALTSPSITSVLEDGAECKISDGVHEVIADLPKEMGGNGNTPSPGFYARAGIAACVSMGIKMLSLRAGYEFRTIKVQVETDFDDRGIYSLADCKVSPLETRVNIQVDCDLDDAELNEFIQHVLDHDTWFVALRDSQSVKATISNVALPKAEGE
jgi:uncharacterized OsmC-like protein